MKTSESILNIAPALLKAQEAITFAEKSAENPYFNSKYADLPTVINAVKPHLNANGIIFLQMPTTGETGSVFLTTRLLHISGEWIESTASCPLLKSDPQAFGSAITYVRRYALAAAVGLYQDDDDANTATYHDAPSAPATYRRPEPAARQVSRPSATIGDGPQPTRPTAGKWQTMIVPPFIKKYSGQHLGDMPEKDVLWWANNYIPRPFKGKISAQDTAFRAALTVAAAHYSVKPQEDETQQPDAPAPGDDDVAY
jgi:hypothetical protein